MSNFLNKSEKLLSNEFEKQGFIIKDIKDQDSLKKIKKIFVDLNNKNLKTNNNYYKKNF